MKRKQLYLDEDTDRALKRLATRTGRSEASHVREALRRHIERHDERADEDPLLRLIGLVDEPDGPDDVSVNHDHYLYGAPKVEP
jgi:thymidylate kinase